MMTAASESWTATSPRWYAKLCCAVALQVPLSCTNAKLFPIVEEQPVERQRLTAEMCAPEPGEAFAPYRVLFVIDTSLSNSWNDPENRRETAVRNAITSMNEEESVSFGIITFSDEPRRQTFGFTRDRSILDGAIENVSSTQGGTNYSDTLWAVIEFILDDITTMPAGTAAQTHYEVFWLSDGFPTVGVTLPEAIYPSMTYLTEQVGDRVAEIRFNTAFLGATDGEDPTDIAQAEDLLATLATMGDGTFTSIPQGESFGFTIDRVPIPTFFEFSFAYVHNRHTVLGPAGPIADSDADGMEDELELALELDPVNVDSDGDGFHDGLEYFPQGALDPRRVDEGCANQEDPDVDGLLDCEEHVLGTSAGDPDSDGDKVLDSLEMMRGTAPTEHDTGDDNDLDDINNLDEIRFHMDPRLPNTPADLADWGYRYQVEELARADANAPPCYRMIVENLSMAETLEMSDHPVGGNIFDVVVAFSSSETTVFQRAELRGQVLNDVDLWDPPGGQFFLTKEDFDHE